MSSDVQALAERLRQQQARVDATRAELHAAILEALQRGERQSDLARQTGYTRERLRQLAEAARNAATSPAQDG